MHEARWSVNRQFWEFVAVVALALAIGGLLLLRTNLTTPACPEFRAPKDHHKYIWMASDDVFDFHIAPFCWRIGTPLAVRYLPLDVLSNFLMVSLVSIVFTGVTVYYLVKTSGLPTLYGIVGMLMFFSLGNATKLALNRPWSPDALLSLFVGLAVLTILGNRKTGFLLLLALGVLIKESVLFVAPLYYTLNARRVIDARLALKTAVLVVPSVVVLLLVRILIPARNDDTVYLSTLPETLSYVQKGTSHYGYYWCLKQVGLPRISHLSLDSLHHFTTGTFGAMVMLLPFFAASENLKLLVRFSPFLLLVYSQLLFATDTERLLILGFPAMILLALNGARFLAAQLKLGPAQIITLPAVFLGLNLLDRNSEAAPFEIQAMALIVYLAFAFQAVDKNRQLRERSST